MPHLRLHLSDFRFGLSASGTGGGWRASWKTGMGWLESVKLSNGSDLAKMSGSLHVRAGEIEEGDRKPIGALHHLEAYGGSNDGVDKPEPETYSVEVVLPEAELWRLLDLEGQGRGPSNISVEVLGMGYGVLPDGSDKTWQLKDEQSWLPVVSLHFGFATKADEGPRNEIEEDFPAEVSPSLEVEAIHQLGADLGKVLTWVMGLLALIAIATIWR